MSIKSMTGFGRADGTTDDIVWHWEVRSVNGRGLDVRVRVPPGQEVLDQAARKAVSGVLTRGNVNITLAVYRTLGATEIRLNEDVLRQVMAAGERARSLTGGGALGLEAMLQIKGVLEIAEPDEAESDRERRHGEMLSGLEAALKEVVATRSGEGSKLAAVVSAHLDEIASLVERIANVPSRTPAEVSRRIGENIRRLLGEQGVSLDQDRLYQEAVLVAAKADVEEELQRLRAHVEAAREFLTKREPVGRKLDFLTQEFNREANTICSKANDIEVTRAGLALKAVIEQMREQVQNIE